jgi:ssDNA-binding Zn-finger/Zn-ribbon topoisomerase 1
MSEINKKLATIQKNLKAPKNQRNSFGNYNYRSCEEVLEAVKPLLGDLTLTISDRIIRKGDRYYVEATVTLSDGKEKIEVTALAREEAEKKGMSESQITGSASSYARKYALNGIFAIDDAKDADTMDNRSIIKPPKATPTVGEISNQDIEDVFGKVCPDCGKEMQKRTAKTGKSAGREFFGCSGYPACKKTVAINDPF